MASQETHASVENHASSPIPSHEEEEAEDPAQLVAHITPKSPAQIITIIKALVDQFCDWHHSQNPSQGKLVRRDVYPHLGLSLRKAEPHQNAYNTWLHHEGSNYKTSGEPFIGGWPLA
ncbi:hypothetical protein M407DRAFT_33682 [Tulasnella calospora MUT 4182]|uniref:Uncharacterized protein n=1 Tax=Tulasnella calospora MUT 4182 TaxID=1051891 RepID=A0A0C3PQ66_9AGAM|nr:hypothetical protein M407DRAFT_33682 [Tulasnella calospora MUT 4182]